MDQSPGISALSREQLEERSSLLWELATDALLLFHVDPDPADPAQLATLVDANEAAEAMLGYSERSALLQASFLDWSPAQQPDGRNSVVAATDHIQSLLRTGQVDVVWQFQRPSTGEQWLGQVSGQLLQTDPQQRLLVRIRDCTSSEWVSQAGRYRALFEASLDSVIVLEANGTLLDANPAAAQIYGYADVPAFLASSLLDWMPERQPDGSLSSEQAPAEIRTCLEQGRHEFLWQHRRPDSGELWLGQVLLQRLDLEAGQLVMARVRDVTASQQLEQALRWEQERYQALFTGSIDALLVFERDDAGVPRVMAVNPAAAATFGYADGAALHGTTPLDWSPQQQPDGRLSNAAAESYWAEVYGTGLAAFDWQFRRPDSGALWLGAVQLQMIAAESRQAVIGRVRDITEQRRAEEQIHRLAYRDALTGLPNRPATLEWLQQQLAAAAGPPLLLIKFDLDDFRALNEAFGDQQGDQLLQHVARAFPPRLPAEAWLSRLGSDDFLLVLPLPQDGPALQAAVEASRWVARLQAWLLLPEDVPQSAGLLRCTLSAGLVLHRGGDTTATELLSQAETALRHAKLSGPGSHQLYSVELSKALQRRITLERDLGQAIAEGQLHLVFQPQFDAQRRIVAAEALLRFVGPEGPVSPDEFIPLAEQNGQIHLLAAWVMEAACSQLAEWRAQGLAPPPLSLNISARQLDAAPAVVPLLAQLQDLLNRYGLQPEQLTLEITETALLSVGMPLRLALQQLVDRGFRLAIDDFGVGYSSLAILRDYPLTELKIDKAFVRDLLRNPRCRSLVKGIATYARDERITLVAEGVETEAQFHLLQDLQVDHFQGYWFSKPLRADDFAALLQASAA